MYQHFVGSSLFVLANLLPNPPSFTQVHAGWRLDPDDVVIVLPATWRYRAPLGIPYGRHYEDPAFDYPGRIRDHGVGLAWQHYWWRGLFTTAHATPFLHVYQDEDGDVIQRGFQLWLSGRVGWNVRFA